MPRHRPRTIQDAIDRLREEIAERQTALKVLYELVSHAPDDDDADAAGHLRVGAPVPPARPDDARTESTPPPPIDEPAPANVLELPKRDAG